jgi:8-oxo-dGTP pyrophosphatase MutT (NUDIX family)
VSKKEKGIKLAQGKSALGFYSKKKSIKKKIKKKVLVWIFSKFENENHFLVLKTIEKRGGYWQPVTGSVDTGETFEQGALREVYEETHFEGLSQGEWIDLKYIFEYETVTDKISEKCFGLRLKLKENTPLPEPKLEPKEHTGFEWVSFEEAIQRIKYESNKEALGKLYQIIHA